MYKKISLALELLAYPFLAIDFNYGDSFVALAEKENKISSLLTDVMFDIGQRVHIHSYDEVKLYLQKYYPFLFTSEKLDSEKVYQHYDKVLNNLSKSIVSHRDGKIVFKYWHNEADEDCFGPYTPYQKIHIMQLLLRIMPMDILVCNYLLENELNDVYQLHDFYSHILLADKQLEEKLQCGVSENHMHMGTGFHFTIMWMKVMNQFSIFPDNQSSSSKYDYLNYLNKMLSRNGESQGTQILFAMLLRVLLAMFLKNRTNRDSFNNWLEEYTADEIKEFLTILRQDCKTRELLTAKRLSEEDISIEYYETIWNRITQNELEFDDANEVDYITGLFGIGEGLHTYGENIFLFYALQYRKENTKDTFFYKIFLKYLRIKNSIFSSIVQLGSSQIKGLDFFKTYYRKASTAFWMTFSKSYYKTIFRTLFQDQYLKQLEVRISPMAIRKTIKTMLESYLEVIDKDYNKGKKEFPKLGIVVHFLKREDYGYCEKCWKEYDDSERTKNRILYGQLQEEYLQQMNEIKELHNEIPYLSEFLVGVDAASGENDTPVSVFAPVFEQMRNSDSQPLITRDKDGNLVKNKSFDYTFHAGEDFRHILSGLRRMDEVITYCKFHSGDRIGHGTALGIQIDRWARENPVVILPRGEYLDNLLWVWGCYTKDNHYDPKHILYLESQIIRYAKEIYQNIAGITISMLYSAYEKQFQIFENLLYHEIEDIMPSDNAKLFCCRVKDEHTSSWDEDKLSYARHCSCYVKPYYEPIQVGISEIDIEIAQSIQNIVKRKIATKGIVIEVNPTSNLAIGEMNSLLEHQAFALNKIEDADLNSIILSINSDDPAVFNTNVCNEIAYLYYGLLDQKVGREECLKWIDKLREYGMQTSFVSREDTETYYEHLIMVINELQ